MADTIEDASWEKQLQKKQKRQQRNRRGNTLIKKVYELSVVPVADADVFLGIRFRDGRVKTFCADQTSFWSLDISYLFQVYFHVPAGRYIAG
jgi:hypothetical protein